MVMLLKLYTCHCGLLETKRHGGQTKVFHILKNMYNEIQQKQDSLFWTFVTCSLFNEIFIKRELIKMKIELGALYRSRI